MGGRRGNLCSQTHRVGVESGVGPLYQGVELQVVDWHRRGEAYGVLGVDLEADKYEERPQLPLRRRRHMDSLAGMWAEPCLATGFGLELGVPGLV